MSDNNKYVGSCSSCSVSPIMLPSRFFYINVLTFDCMSEVGAKAKNLFNERFLTMKTH